MKYYVIWCDRNYIKKFLDKDNRFKIQWEIVKMLFTIMNLLWDWHVESVPEMTTRTEAYSSFVKQRIFALQRERERERKTFVCVCVTSLSVVNCVCACLREKTSGISLAQFSVSLSLSHSLDWKSFKSHIPQEQRAG